LVIRVSPGRIVKKNNLIGLTVSLGFIVGIVYPNHGQNRNDFRSYHCD